MTSGPVRTADRERARSLVPRRTNVRRVARGSWVTPLATVVLTIVALVPVLKLWRADLHVPMTGYAADANLNTALVKGVLEHGWFQTNPDAGAPFGQELWDFPVFSGDNLHFVVIKLLGLFSDDPAVVINLFFLLGFPLSALAALYAFRALGVAREPALVCSILFAFLPYHFYRGVLSGHLFLAAYWSIPLACALVLAVLAGDAVFARRRAPSTHRSLEWVSAKTLGTLGLVLVIGSSGLYYALFAVFLLALAGALAALARRSVTPLVTGGILAAAITLVVVANLTPNILYRWANGPNPVVGKRLPEESEANSLKLSQLLLPISGHRLDRLAFARARYDTTTPPPPDYGVALGTLGAIGLVVLLVAVAAGALGVRGPPLVGERLRHAGVIAVASLLTITVGGFSTLVAYAITPQVRGWYRFSVFVGFLALLAVALLLTTLRNHLVTAHARGLFAGALGALLVLGVLDQTSDSFVPRYADTAVEWRSDRAFVRRIEHRLPASSEVFQIPYVAFPEAASGNINAYEAARGYIHSRDLQWSWGSMRGRPDDWQAELADDSPDVTAAAVAAAGFEGIYIDREGYADHGAAVEAELSALIRAAPLESVNGRLSFFDLRGFVRRERARYGARHVRAIGSSTLHPLRVVWGTGFSEIQWDGATPWRSATDRAELVLENPSSEPRRTLLSAAIQRGSARPSTLEIGLPGGRRERLELDARPTELRRAIVLPPGRSVVTFTADVPAKFLNAQVLDSALAALERRFAPAGSGQSGR